jgi:hypothetical protein
MTTFVLIHGAGDGAWYWHLLLPSCADADRFDAYLDEL